ncbi:ATP-binding protein [Pseudothauera nasutitermitis]|nr:ATP-binding protein [Pseudothauera nasutitermitis]
MPVSLTLSLSVRTLPEAREAARRGAALCGGSVAVETGLTELLVNAVEHGNLGIDHACKARLLANGTWASEVERRLAESARGRRYARLRAWRSGRGWCFEIADAGAGFDWRPWLDLAATRGTAPNGRGIALAAALYFDRLRFLPPGNRVRAWVNGPPGSAGRPGHARGRAIAYNRAP